jgi:hypothetical protein
MVTFSITAERLETLRADPEIKEIWVGELELIEAAVAAGIEVTLPEAAARDMGLFE